MKRLKLRKNLRSPQSLQRINADLQRPGDMGRVQPSPVKGLTEKTKTSAGTQIYTSITTATGQTELLYAANSWVSVQLLLETAGPVEVSTRDEIAPLLSGKGIPLFTGVLYELTLSQGDRLWIAASAINRVQVIISPFPWLQSIVATLSAGFRGLIGKK